MPEVTPEELSQLNEPGQRALKAEREARKAAKAETRELKARLAELEAQVAAPPANEPPAANEPTPEPAAQPVAAAPTPSVATPALADCHTFEAVEARGLAAVNTENLVVGLQTKLARNDVAGVVAELAANGVQKLDNVPLAEATPEALTDFLQSALAGAKLTQAQMAPRQRFIAVQNQSWQAAAQVLPAMNNVKSPEYQAIAQFVQANPVVKSMPNWPQIAVKLLLGERAFNAKGAPAPAAAKPGAKPAAIRPAPATVPAPVAPALRAAPGAPSTSASALPASKRSDELSALIASGKATLAQVDEYARTSLA